MKKHALLSPSKSSIWLNCTPSARLSEKYDRKSNQYSDEGTLAHTLAEWLIKRSLDWIGEPKLKQELTKVKANTHYSNAMYEHCTRFASYVVEQYNAMAEKHNGAMIFLEVNLDLTKWVPEGFGTGDVVIVAGHEIWIIDLKYGKGVFVETMENTQMMIYALGAIDACGTVTDDVKRVKMTIYQPRLDNIETWEIPANKLYEWGRTILIPKADQAFQGLGDLFAGEHCIFCPCRATCSTHAKYNLTVAGEEFDETVEPTDLDDNKLVEIYLRAKQIKSWLASIEEHMVEKAVEGKSWKGLKLVHGRSVRIITDPVKVLTILKKKGYSTDKFLSKPELLGITALENNIGAKEFAKLAGEYVMKPLGKPSLVHAEAKGIEYSANNSAADDFS